MDIPHLSFISDAERPEGTEVPNDLYEAAIERLEAAGISIRGDLENAHQRYEQRIPLRAVNVPLPLALPGETAPVSRPFAEAEHDPERVGPILSRNDRQAIQTNSAGQSADQQLQVATARQQVHAANDDIDAARPSTTLPPGLVQTDATNTPNTDTSNVVAFPGSPADGGMQEEIAA